MNKGITETHPKFIHDPVIPYHFIVTSDCSKSTKLDVSNILSTHSTFFFSNLEKPWIQSASAQIRVGCWTCNVLCKPTCLERNPVLGLSDRMVQISGCLLCKPVFVPIALLWIGDNVVPSCTSAVGKISPSVLIKQLSPAVLSTSEKPWRAE